MTSQFQLGSLAACVALVLISKVLYSLAFDRLKEIPGPVHARLSRILLSVQVLRGQRTQYIHHLHQKYGRIVRVAPEEVAVSDLNAFRSIHRIGGGFDKSPWYLKFVTSPRPGMFAMTDPKEHAARRKVFAQRFANTSVLKFEDVIREKVGTAVSKIKRDAENGVADIFKWFTFMATDIAGQLSFGASFEMLRQEQQTPYIRDLGITMKISGVRAELGWLVHLMSWLPVEALQEALYLPRRLQDYGTKAVLNHRARVLEGNSNTASLFSRFLDPKHTQNLTTEDIAIEASNMIIAGPDTTSVSLTYLIWALLRPENVTIKERVLQEIHNLPSDAGVADLANSEYLKAVINEALRLYGAAPGSLPRIVPKSGLQCGDYYVPEGMAVSTQAFSIHRDPTYFTDPKMFSPERWLNPTPEMKTAFHPFGVGSRVCIGMHLAMLELFTGLVFFFRTCPSARLAASTTDATMEFENYFLIAPKGHRCEITLA